MTRSLMVRCLLAVFVTGVLATSAIAFTPGHTPVPKTTLLDAGEADYDINYLKFDLHVADTSLFVWGNVSTTARVVASTMSVYVFELDTLMLIDSAKVNGVLLPVATTGFVRKITIPSLSSGSFFTAQVFYHGFPPVGGGFFNGLTHAISAAGTHMLYNVSDPWVALDWWPCKQSADDKIDSVDMYVTVPRGVVDGSNGVLVGVDTSTTPGYWQYHWQTHYPITDYLISIAVARYTEYRSYLHFTGSSDSMLIQNFFMDTATFNPAYKARFDSIGLILDYFSTLFGRYPFWQEKYGMCYTNLPGGMENQTMTTIGDPTTNTIAHELGHQWFGDNVTYWRWGDVWLSEGFATFCEQLFYDHFWSNAAAVAHRKTLLASALAQTCGEVYVTDTSGPTTLFFQPNVYYKAQGVITMLRFLAPSDELFFQALRDYQSSYALKNAYPDDLRAKFELAYGFSLDTFFNQWIYGKGYPMYRISWNQSGSNVFIKLIQTRSCSSYNNTFHVPVEVRLSSATMDTMVRLDNYLDTQVFTITWPQVMDTIYFNPDALTVCKLLAHPDHDYTLGLARLPGQHAGVYPNPSKNNWQIDALPENVDITLTNVKGRVIWRGHTGKGPTIIPGQKLPPGDYYLLIDGNKTDSIKLVHW